MENTMEIFRQSDAESAAAEAGEYLSNFLADKRKIPILLLLSGGSSFSILTYVGKSALGANLTITMLDERFSQDAEVNNFAQLQKKDFYALAFEAEANFFGTLPRPAETKEQLAERMGKNWRQWRQQNPDGLVAATLGMGQDGHTAGMLPFAENPAEFHRLFKGGSWVAAYDAGLKNPHPMRVTATADFFRQINFGFAYVCGADKKTKFAELTGGQKNAAALPAAVWREIPDVKIFTDIN